jgi:hypothetical protein
MVKQAVEVYVRVRPPRPATGGSNAAGLPDSNLQAAIRVVNQQQIDVSVAARRTTGQADDGGLRLRAKSNYVDNSLDRLSFKFNKVFGPEASQGTKSQT